MATQEGPPRVEPVTSPTDQLSQVVTVNMRNAESVAIIAESGRFTSVGDFNDTGHPALVNVILLPDTTHHLEVFAKVKKISYGNGSCFFGDYTMSTKFDKNRAPLVIKQVQPAD